MESKFIQIGEHRIHYREEGQGAPILFIHGNPTSSLLWRNVLPGVSSALGGRGIAIDLLGFGKSDKPELQYNMVLHYQIVEKFISALSLKNLTLVVHDWGGALGMRYAVERPENVSSIVAMETLFWNSRFEDFPKKWQPMFKVFRGPIGTLLFKVLNSTDKMIQGGVLKTTKIPKDVLAEYKNDLANRKDRTAARAFPAMVLLNGLPIESKQLLDETENKLKNLKSPVAYIRATPGTEYDDTFIQKLRDGVPQLELIEFGPGGHYLQEDDPVKLTGLICQFINKHGGLPKTKE